MGQTISAVVVSQGRPELLARCLMSLSQQQRVDLEVVVVADAASLDHLAAGPFVGRFKPVLLEQANISLARNMGIQAAAGDVVAFIDDDSAAEPTWAAFLTAPLADPSVIAATGFVRGRNGITFQWKAEIIDVFGNSHPMSVPEDEVSFHLPPKNGAIKTPGTNMAFRRADLIAAGGFDERLHFYLDESDLNIRLSSRGLKTAVVPFAQVHHAYAASARRAADRTPTSLFEIGASQSVFLSNHCPPDEVNSTLRRFASHQNSRLLRSLQRGPMGPETVFRLRRELAHGVEAGKKRGKWVPHIFAEGRSAFISLCSQRQDDICLKFMRPWNSAKMIGKIADLVVEGQIITVLEMAPTSVYHHVLYTNAGYWLQKGGTFGRSDRSDPIFRFTTFQRRCRKEILRVSKVRGIAPCTLGTKRIR
ncbi:MAG: glycosyltransferase family 2 protein [Pseudomonadota bacterium]|nr:glycosyltransferase family 2 protein [Pseudomonadota bacterium]MEE3070285.1 glycosyltransferase family 2 protein [Pseudomonadota bacterium]